MIRAVAGVLCVLMFLGAVVHAIGRWDRVEQDLAELARRDVDARATAARHEAEIAALRTLVTASGLDRVRLDDHEQHLARCRLRMMDVRVAIDTLVTAWPRKARAVPPVIADWPDWPAVGGSIGSPMDPRLPAELARWRPDPPIEP